MAILVVMIGAVYYPAIHTPFIFDDSGSVEKNSSITRLLPLMGDPDHPGPLNPPKDLPTSGRPLVNFSLAVNYHLGQLDASGYHIVNIVLHILSALLLAAIVRRALTLPYFGGRFERAAAPLSFLVALVWALHPLQTEAVVYITQRTELMVGLFFLATLYTSLRYWTADTSRARGIWLVAATLACMAGMASKEVMVSAPVVVLLFGWMFIARESWDSMRRGWPLALGFGLGLCVLLLLNIDAPRGGTAGFGHNVPLLTWWFTQAKALCLYAKLTFWPWPLMIHYDFPYLKTAGEILPWLLPALAMAIATAILLWRKKPAGFLAACVWLILSPTLVVPILTEVAAERRMYLPLTAIVVLVVVGGFELLRRRTGARRPAAARATIERRPIIATATAAAAASLLFAVLIAHRLPAYESELALWSDAASHRQDNALVQYNFANELVRKNRYAEAIEHYQAAIKNDPYAPGSYNNLGSAFIKSGQPQLAIEPLKHAIKLKPGNSEALNNLGNATLDLNQPQQAIDYYQQALAIAPDLAEAHYNLGRALAKTGQRPAAVDSFERSIKLNPGYFGQHLELGNTLYEMDQFQSAVEHFQKAVQLNPESAESECNLGLALVQVNRPQDAIAHCQTALRLRPDYTSAQVNCTIALALCNRREEAIASAEKALALARSHNQTNIAEFVEKWLVDYRTGKIGAATLPATNDLPPPLP